MMLTRLLPLSILVSCAAVTSCGQVTTAGSDGDMDGHLESVDCDDGDPSVYPGAAEICDGKDNDCDDQQDEDEVCAPELLETVTVSSDGTEVASITDYPRGQTFLIEASGDYQWGLCDPQACPGGAACNYSRLGDAGHRTDDCWTSLVEDLDTIALYLDGAPVAWGAYNPEHVYSVELAGTDAPFRFHINDCPTCYGDNTGQIIVRIYAPPSP